MKPIRLLRAHRWFVIFALLAGTQSSRAQTWIQWSSAAGGNNHYYALTPCATNWTAAQKLAVSWGGTLATITSSNEQNFINTTFLAGTFEHRPLWIGLVDPPPKGSVSAFLRDVEVRLGFRPKFNFHWVTGKPLGYINWKPGEPNNAPPGESYGTINWEYSDDPPRGVKGDWNDTPLNGTTGYGGNTSGPYFGLVERETDPGQPQEPWIAKGAPRFCLIALLAAVLIIVSTRFSRRKRSS
jgi:hypothetical protein